MVILQGLSTCQAGPRTQAELVFSTGLCQLPGSLALAKQAIRVYLLCSPLESFPLPPWHPAMSLVCLCLDLLRGPSAVSVLKHIDITGSVIVQGHRDS